MAKGEKMKVGDLVTLSSYGEKFGSLYRWSTKLFPDRPKLIGLVVKIMADPNARSWTSKNERTHYFINWINKDCPVSRYGNVPYRYHRATGYFLRNDLKFVRKG